MGRSRRKIAATRVSTVRIDADRHQLDPAVRKVQHLEGARVLDEALDVVGDHLLRIDEHIDRHVLLREEAGPMHVDVGADARDLHGRAEQGIAHLACHHVHFVGIGDGDEHVRVLGPGASQDVGMRGHALDGLDVEAVAQSTEPIGVDIEHRDVGFLVRQILGQGATDLSCTEDEDLHAPASVCRSRQE